MARDEWAVAVGVLRVRSAVESCGSFVPVEADATISTSRVPGALDWVVVSLASELVP